MNGDNYPSFEASADNRSAQVIQVESSKLLGPLMAFCVLSCVISGIAIGLSMGARDNGQKAERETRLMRLEVDELKVALKTQGIATHEGSTP